MCLHLHQTIATCLKALSGFRTQLLAALLLLFFSPVFSQQNIISGKITDENSNPLGGVTVRVQGTSTVATTDVDGIFSISASKGQTLEISYVGMIEQRVTIGNATNIEVVLRSKASSDLDEVVVTGYMTQKKADLTGAVAVVTPKELTKSHGGTNVMQSLQGVVPGMRVTTDGNPAGNVGIQVRGLTSMNGGAPLIVIDGVPSYMNLRDINPENIASMQVLKDAYSASIYGTQGGAGVILIQTKKGQAGKAKISYSGSVGYSAFWNKVPMLNTQQYGEALWRAAVNDGQDPNGYTKIYDYEWHTDASGNPVLDKVTPVQYLNANKTMLAANTNWLDAISQLGVQHNHQLTVSGGNEKSTSLLSLNFMQNQGIMIHTGFKRFSVRLNTEYKVINDRLSIGENIEVAHIIDNNQNVMHDAMVMPAIIPVYTTDGGWGGSAVSLGMDDYWNPVRTLTLNRKNGNKYNKIFGDVHANLVLVKNLTLRSQLGLVYTDGYHRNIRFSFEEGGGKFDPISNVNQWYWREAILDLTNTLNYKFSIGKHNLDALAGMQANKFTSETMDVARQTLAFQNYDYAYLSTATGNMSMSGNGDKYNLLSYFGKFNYSFDSRYLLSGSLRYDGSSKFGANNRFALFPAFAAGWRINNEAFMADNQFISDLKIRASWGRNGSLANMTSLAAKTYFASNYNYTSYAITGNISSNLPSGFNRERTGNSDLRWETTTQTNIGVDFGFLSQKISGSIDFYKKYTDGMLIQPPYLGTLGEGAYTYYNAANMTNKGVELTLAYQGNTGKSFSYQVKGNVTYNKNIINDLPASVRYSWGGSALKGDGIAGHPWGAYYGFIADGLFKTQEELDNSAEQTGKGLGRIRFKDISGPDGKPDGVIDYDYDRTWIGNGPIPKWEYGFGVNLAYKNFDFSMFWQGIGGIMIYNGWKTYSDFWNVWIQNGFNHPSRILGAWSPENPGSDIPALSTNNVNDEIRMSTYLIEPGNYLKMRNVQLGYNFPQSLRSRLGMEKLYFFVMAENIIGFKSKKFTSLDPETPDGAAYSNPYVRPQILKAGIEVSF
ncbi:MAG: TonB-dependent receptor [Chitinophagaceae bacterium]|nr:TonB-dependent receptor [Chitinophagaceae bacterium]